MDHNSQSALTRAGLPSALESILNLPQDDLDLLTTNIQRLNRERNVLKASLTSLKEIYTRYLDSVRADGFEPRRLLEGIDIDPDGPNAPPRDFWTLLPVRDRIILEANALLRITEQYSPTFVWSNHFAVAIPVALGLVSIFTWFKSRFRYLALPFAGSSIFLVAYLFWNSSRHPSWSRPGIKSLVEKVTNWEDVKPNRRQSMWPW